MAPSEEHQRVEARRKLKAAGFRRMTWGERFKLWWDRVSVEWTGRGILFCPRCHSQMVKVIYLGLPGWLCSSDGDRCNVLMGPAELVARVYFNGGMMVFEGSYLRALWHWVRGAWNAGEDE